MEVLEDFEILFSTRKNRIFNKDFSSMNSAKSANTAQISKQQNQAFKYPLVIKQVGMELMISAPDFGFYETVELTAKSANENTKPDSAKSANLQLINQNEIELVFDSEVQKNLAKKMKDVWDKIAHHLEEKKWIPDPSSFKHSIQQGEEDLSLPDFTKRLQEHMSISENTVRREIARGRIRCLTTDGGHRRIPVSEIESYLKHSYLKHSYLK